MFLTLDENFSTYFYKTFSTNIDKLSTAVLYYNIYMYIYIYITMYTIIFIYITMYTIYITMYYNIYIIYIILYRIYIYMVIYIRMYIYIYIYDDIYLYMQYICFSFSSSNYLLYCTLQESLASQRISRYRKN